MKRLQAQLITLFGFAALLIANLTFLVGATNAQNASNITSIGPGRLGSQSIMSTIGDHLDQALLQGTPTGTATLTTATSSASPTYTNTHTPTRTPSPTPTCGGSWRVAEALPSPVFGAGMASDGAYGYAVGGYNLTLNEATTQFAKYDPLSNNWTSLPALSHPVYNSLVVYSPGTNKLYVFGGTDDTTVLTTTRIFDLAAGTWSVGAPMPAPRQQMGGGYYSGNGKIYVVGGFDSIFISPQAQTWEYDPIADTWNTALSNMPEPLGGPGSGIVNDRLYIIGGSDASSAARDQVYEYNITTNMWHIRQPMPNGANVPGSAVVNGTIWIFGGGNPFLKGRYGSSIPKRDDHPQTTNLTQIYITGNDTWRVGVGLNFARSFVGGTNIGGYIIAAGGYDGVTAVDTVEVAVEPISCVPQATPTITPTPTPRPTVCTVQFEDVRPDHLFYSFVYCLACRGVVAGYPCGAPGEPCGPQSNPYYRPAATVTRGQLAKILSSAAGFADPIPSSRQTFTDVLPSNEFWLWIERLVAHNSINGYPCGELNEPCIGPNNRPYFRPNNNVTRGQLSKITSGAAGWTETPTGQTFEDAPPGSTFYLYIERLATRGIISGYPCGGPFEPCVGPTNRPYFRWGNTTTRAQMAKFAALSFFPNCSSPIR